MARKPRVLDLFCGAGGLSHGFVRAGFSVVGGVEVNEVAFKTFLHNHVGARRIRNAHDVTKVSATDVLDATGLDVGELDVIAGGPPCQGFSTAGFRERTDARNALVFHFVRLVDELRPKYFVMENVVGLLSMRNSAGSRVLSELKTAFDGIGYSSNIPTDESSWSSLVLNAADFGVPQRRRRVFVFGARDDLQLPPPPTATHAPRDVLPFTGSLSPYVTVRDAISDLPQPTTDGPTPLPSKKGLSEFAKAMRATTSSVYNHTPTRHKPFMVEKMRDQPAGKPLYDTWAHAWVRLDEDEPSPTVKENHNAPFVHPTEPRVVSPRECARLQSFPDAFRFFGPKSKQLVQIGNAVPPLLGEAVARSVLKAVRAQERREREATRDSQVKRHVRKRSKRSV